MDRKIWENPRAEKSLDEAQTPLWFWNDKLEKKELLRQLEEKTRVGVTCTNPHARTNNGEGYIGGYLDEEWFANFSTVLDYKREHHEPLWLYDEIDWPAGTCSQTITRNEQYREQYLAFTKVEIPAGQPFRAQLKELTGKSVFAYKASPDKDSYAFNVYIFDAETMQPYDIKDYFKYLIFGPELEFKADKDSVAYLVKIHVDPYEYGGNGQVSYINKEATRAFLASTYDKYYERYEADFGETITSVFNDETRMCNPLPWSREFPQEFKDRKGYDLMPRLIDLILPGEKAGRTRCDYFDVLADLYQQNYFGELHSWCEEHRIKLFAHLLGEETMFGHARYSGDYLRQNRYLDIPGADHLGKGIGSLNIKYTSAGAHSYGKDITAVEVFAGCGWDMTFEEYTRMITWMYQMGMKIIINHGFFYSDRGNRKNDWPPSQFFQWKGWPRMQEGNAMVRRLHYALTGGVSEMDVLVYHPMESFWLNYEPDMHYTHGFAEGAFLKNEQAVRTDREMQLLMNGLLSRNLDFDILHKDALENFKVEKGQIVNCKNGQRFSVLLLPMCRVLPIEAARLLREFAREGGKIIAMDEIPALAMPACADEELLAVMKEIEGIEGALIQIPAENKDAVYEAVAENIPHPVRITAGEAGTINQHPCYPPYLIDPYMHGGEDLQGVMFTRYIKDGKRHTLFMNYNMEPSVIEVMADGLEIPQIWDTFTGEIREAEVLERTKTGCRIKISLPCYYGIILVTGL